MFDNLKTKSTIGSRSPLTRKGYKGKPYGETSKDSDISFVSSGRPSTDHLLSSLSSNPDTGMSHSRLSSFSDMDGNYSFESMYQGRKSTEISTPPEFSSLSFDSDGLSTSTAQAVVRKYGNVKLYFLHCHSMY